MAKLEKKKSKLSFKEFVWFGFNFVFGGTFVTTFASFANEQKQRDNDGKLTHLSNGLGLYVLLVWFVVGMFAFICARAFAKMSRYHDSNQNGASYVYARSTFGKLFGMFIGFLQYCYLPFSLSFQIMSCFKANLAEGFVSNSPATQNWGAFTDLYMDLMSMCCFVLCAMVVFLGMRWFKRLSNITSWIKWFTVGLLIMASFLILLPKDGNNSIVGSTNINDWKNHSSFDIGLFIKCFNSSFFSFLGFELAVTAGKNIQNPNKTVGRGIIVIVLLAIVAYVLLSLLMFCTVASQKGFAENYNVAIWNNLNTTHGVVLTCAVITIIGLISMRFYSYMQKSLYGGTTIQPLAIEGYFPDKFAKLNKEGLPISASKLNLIIVCSMSFIWLIIPDIIKGSLILTSNSFEQKDVFFNMSAFTSFASLIAIAIYISVLSATIYLMINKKINNKNVWLQYSELILYFIASILLLLVFVYHYYDLIDRVIKNHNISDIKNSQDSIKAITSIAIELLSSLGIVAFFFTWYKVYYLRKIKTRTVSRQKELDKPFKLLNAKERAQLIDN